MAFTAQSAREAQAATAQKANARLEAGLNAFCQKVLKTIKDKVSAGEGKQDPREVAGRMIDSYRVDLGKLADEAVSLGFELDEIEKAIRKEFGADWIIGNFVYLKGYDSYVRSEYWDDSTGQRYTRSEALPSYIHFPAETVPARATSWRFEFNEPEPVIN